MSKNKIIIMEHIWGFLTVLNTGLFAIETYRKGFEQSKVFAIMGLMSLIMFLWRRQLRKKEENE